jgi:hypothetical protein
MLGSKIDQQRDGNAERVEWTARKTTLRLGWDVYEDRYLERSVNGMTQDPWPKFQGAEYAQHVCEVRVGAATATARANPQEPLWLLALDAAKTYVVYQPNPRQVVPLALETPLGRVSTRNFPFGKLVFRKRNAGKEEGVMLEIDAQYPAQPSFVEELEVQGARGVLTAIINGQPAPCLKKDTRGTWHVLLWQEPGK